MIKELYKQYPVIFFIIIGGTALALFLIASPNILRFQESRKANIYRITGPDVKGYTYGKWRSVKTVLIGDADNNLVLEFNVTRCRRKTVFTQVTMKHQKVKVGDFYKTISTTGYAILDAGVQCANSKNEVVSTTELQAEYGSLPTTPGILKFEFTNANGQQVYP